MGLPSAMIRVDGSCVSWSVYRRVPIMKAGGGEEATLSHRPAGERRLGTGLAPSRAVALLFVADVHVGAGCPPRRSSRDTPVRRHPGGPRALGVEDMQRGHCR